MYYGVYTMVLHSMVEKRHNGYELVVFSGHLYILVNQSGIILLFILTGKWLRSKQTQLQKSRGTVAFWE